MSEAGQVGPAGLVGVGEEVGKPTLIAKIEYQTELLDQACQFIITSPEVSDRMPVELFEWYLRRQRYLEEKKKEI